MVSIDSIREEFKQRLADKPRGLSANELNEVLNMLLEIDDIKSKILFKRFSYWVSIKDMKKKIVCANVELVRFEVLIARSDRKKNSGVSKPPSLENGECTIAHLNDIKKFFERNHIEANSIKRLPSTVEGRASIIDNWINASLNSKSDIAMPPDEEITIESNDGNKRTQSMQYISVKDLIKCISRSENASTLRDYAMNVIAALEIYNDELSNAKDNAMDKYEDKIDTLIRENREQHKEMEERDKKHSEEIQELLGYAKTTNNKLDEAITKIDKIQKTLDSLSNIVKMTLPMWIGSSVLKTMLDKLKSDYKDDPKVIKCMKIAFVCGFYNKNTLKIYFCCTNFRDVSKRIGELFKRHNARGDMLMMMPRAINLASCDINIELSTIRSKEFENINISMNNKSKSFDIELSDDMNAEDTYELFINQLVGSHLQIYQAHRDRVITEKKLNTNTAVMKYITSSDTYFFDKARPLCQAYLEEFINLHKDIYEYKAASRKQTRYSDFNNMQLTQPEYKLMFIDDIINKDTGIETFEKMAENKEFTEEDIPVMEVIAATKLDTTN